MIKSSVMAQRVGDVNEHCQMLFKMDSAPPACSVHGMVYDPTNVVDLRGITGAAPANDGFAKVEGNGVWIQNDSSTNPAYLDLAGVEFQTTESYVLAATVKTKAATFDANKFQPRINFGAALGSANILTVSFAGGMHMILQIADANGNNRDTLQITSSGTMLLPENFECVIYVAWNGATNTLTCKAINLDGTVYNDGTQDFVLTGTMTPANTVFKPQESFGDFISRWSRSIYYCVAGAKYSTMPNHLDAKLAQWGKEAIKGNKGWAI